MSTADASAKRVRIADHLYERGDRYFLIVRRNGRQIVKALKARNRTEAKAECKIELGKIESGGVAAIGDRSVTLRQLVDAWIAHEQDPATRRVAPTTLATRRILLETHVIPFLKPKTRVTDLTSGHARRLVVHLRKKGLAGSSVRSTVGALSAILNHAAQEEWVPRNVCRDLVRGDLPSGQRETEPRYLTVAEVESLLSKLSDEFRPVAACCYFAALRVSEALALRWSDVDLDGARISIKAGKTAASVADVPLLPRLAAELKAHRERQGRLGFSRIAQDALVFQTLTGRPQSRRNALRAVNVASERADLVPEGAEFVGPHDLRHSFAAYAFSIGLTPPEIARAMRHSNSRVTMMVYAGLAGDAVEDLGTKLAGMGT